MEVFKYFGRNYEGKGMQGEYRAETKADVAEFLRSQGVYPITIEPEDRPEEFTETLRRTWGKPKLKDLAAYCRQLAAIINGGIPIVKALDILQRQSNSQLLAQGTQGAREDLVEGFSLGQAFRNHSQIFPEIFINMVEAGELGGTLGQALEDLAEHFERENDLRNKVRTATTYPIILSIVAIAVVIFVVTNVLPTFAGMYEGFGAALPWPTRILLGTTSFLKQYFWLAALIILVLLWSFIKMKATPKGRLWWEKLYYEVPVLGPTAVKVNLARYARTLSTMLSSGIPLLEAIETLGRTMESESLKVENEKIIESVQRGDGISDALKVDSLFPTLFVEMTAVGEETGQLDEMLGKTADYYDSEVQDVYDRLSVILEPVIMVFMAIIIGFIVIAIILPMFDMLQFVG